jgi:hypothetical protein
MGDEKVARGGYDFISLYSGTKWPEEAKDFLKFYLSGDRLARFDATVPGHLIPPTTELEDAILAMDNEYVQLYSEDIKSLFEAAQYNSQPELYMGAIDPETCEFDPEYNPMPWAGGLLGPWIPAQMIEKVVVGGESAEDAMAWAVSEMERVAEEWKAENPDWEPPISE